MSAALALAAALRDRLVTHAPLLALLGGAHVFDELPRGAQAPYVAVTGIETRDWSVMDQKAHEHVVTIDIATNERSRKLAQAIAHEIELALDMQPLELAGHRLINLRLTSANATRRKSTDTFGAELRFRATTEPL
jgi:hypothetical protein